MVMISGNSTTTATGTSEPSDENNDIVSEEALAGGSDGSEEADGTDEPPTSFAEGLNAAEDNVEDSAGGIIYFTEDGKEITEDEVIGTKEAASTDEATPEQKTLYQQILEDINAATTTREIQQALSQVEPEIPQPPVAAEEMAAATAEAVEQEVTEEKKNEQKAALTKVTQEQHEQLFLAANKRCNILANQAALQGDKKLEKTIKEFQKTYIADRCLEADTAEKKTEEKKSVFKKATDGFAMAKQDVGKALAKLLRVKTPEMSPFNRAATQAKANEQPLTHAERAQIAAEAGDQVVTGEGEYSAKEIANQKNLLAMRREAALLAARRKDAAAAPNSETPVVAHENLDDMVPPEPKNIMALLPSLIGRLIKADGKAWTQKDSDAVVERMLASASGMSEAPEQSRSERTRGALGLVHTKAPKAKKGRAQPKQDSSVLATMGHGARVLMYEFFGTIGGKETGEIKLFGNAQLAGQTTTTRTFNGTSQEAAQRLAQTTGTTSTRFDPDFTLEKSELPDVKEMQRRSETEAKA